MSPDYSIPAPAVFIGVQGGFGGVPSFRLYNLLEPVGPHPAGSTVSDQTLLAWGYTLPDSPQKRRQAMKDSFNPWGED